MLTYFFKWTSRELSKFIKPLFYKGFIKEVIKENYITRYSLKDKKIYKENLKKVYFICPDEEKEKKLKEIIWQNPSFDLRSE